MFRRNYNENLEGIYRLILKEFFRIVNRNCSIKNAVRIMDKQWDYLIILDACRYDVFADIVDKNADFVISGGGTTQEWLEWNFNGKYKDVIYIAGNPHFATLNLVKTFGFNPFFKVIEVWDYGWDNELKTVPPKEVTKAAIKTLDNFPDKRMIIHYNQPHHPFITNKELLHLDDGTWNTLEGGMWDGEKITVWHYLRQGKIPIKKAWLAYKDNLRIVMSEVDNLVKKLHGRVIVSADHGNHFGEYRLFGHFEGIRSEQLVKIPWMILKDEKSTITSKLDEKQKTKLAINKFILNSKITPRD
jgi:hypothetical protein